MTEKFMQYAQKLQNQKLFELEEVYQTNLAAYIPLFLDSFDSICKNIINMQNNGSLGEISSLEYTLLYTNLVQKKDIAEVRVYNNNRYFDAHQRIAGYFDFSFLFVKYRELQVQLIASRKRFPEITAKEIKAFLLSCAGMFYQYVIAACRFAIADCTCCEPFLSVRRTDNFQIRAGEYMARTQAIYKENPYRTSSDVLDLFSKHPEHAYLCENFQGLDFTGADLSKLNLCYADFRKAALAGTDFQSAWLAGARFCQADMRNASLCGCMLNEADFTEAILCGAIFSYAVAYSGVMAHEKWISAGFRRVSFINADLTNADFSKAYFLDADFTGAVMNGTLLRSQQLEHFTLSPPQRQSVHVVDA